MQQERYREKWWRPIVAKSVTLAITLCNSDKCFSERAEGSIEHYVSLNCPRII